MRLFLAISLSKEVVDCLNRVIRSLQPHLPQARWVYPERTHLTLEFLGETSPERLPEITASMRASASSTDPFEIELMGIGAFSSWKDPRVVWLGVQKGADRLMRLQNVLHGHLESRGFELEARAFHPHITLCRVKDRIRSKDSRLQNAADQIRESARMTVTELALFESKLSPQGPAYALLARENLAITHPA